MVHVDVGFDLFMPSVVEWLGCFKREREMYYFVRPILNALHEDVAWGYSVTLRCPSYLPSLLAGMVKGVFFSTKQTLWMVRNSAMCCYCEVE